MEVCEICAFAENKHCSQMITDLNLKTLIFALPEQSECISYDQALLWMLTFTCVCRD